jgi:two-component sensor histidine kinase
VAGVCVCREAFGLQSPRSFSSKATGCLAGHERRSRELRYISAATLVAGGLLVRFILQPVLGANLPYAAFYPVVLLAAYALGPRPAALAAVLSAAIAYWGIAQPTSPWTWNADAAAPLLAFLGTSAVAICLVGVLIRHLEGLAVLQARGGVLADSHSGALHALDNRVAHHQQLISGLLAQQTQGEMEPALSAPPERALEQSLDMARIHRDFAGQDDEPVDFQAFACALVGASPVRIEVVGGGVILPRNQATSLGVALLECISALASRKAKGQIRVSVSADATRARLRMSELDGATGLATASLADAFLLRATVGQLGGRLRVSADREGSAIELSFPRTATAADTAPERALATLH